MEKELTEEEQLAIAGRSSTNELTQICAWCGRVLDRSGDWREPNDTPNQLGATPPSHGICPDCVRRLNIGG